MVLVDLTTMIMLGGGFEFVVAPLDQCAPGSPPQPMVVFLGASHPVLVSMQSWQILLSGSLD